MAGSGACLPFACKAAAEIGELGDNTRTIRAAIPADELLRRALARPTPRCGPRPHPLGQRRHHLRGQRPPPRSSHGRTARRRRPLRGRRVERRRRQLRRSQGLRRAAHPPAGITTDAKVIPTLTSRQLAGGADAVEAFRGHGGGRMEGSVAIAAQSAIDPEALLLALRGSGQALYVGLADDAYIVAPASRTAWSRRRARYLRVDGDTPADPTTRPAAGARSSSSTPAAGALAGPSARPTTGRRCRSPTTS